MRVTGAFVALFCACSSEGDYTVCWGIGEQPGIEMCGGPGVTQASLTCAASGLDTVVLDWVDGTSGLCEGELVDTSEHACRTGVASGFVEAGTYTLCVEGLAPDGARLTGAVATARIPIRDGDLTVVTLSLPVVPQCGNGLDDEPDGGDGRIDDLDPQCSDAFDIAE